MFSVASVRGFRFLLKPAHTDEEMAQYFVVITGVGIFALQVTTHPIDVAVLCRRAACRSHTGRARAVDQLKSKCLLHHWECASSW